jgi:hypothetical protein
MTALYNCKHDGDQYRITKFIDGNPEASYLCTTVECECPAGSRPSCRHRQMLPAMLDRHLCNSTLFWNHDDGGFSCDINGSPKRETIVVPKGQHDTEDTDNIDWDTLAEERLGQRPRPERKDDTAIADAVPNGPEEDTSPALIEQTVDVSRTWRRL